MAEPKPDRNRDRRRPEKNRPRGSQSPDAPRRSASEPLPLRDPALRLKVGITMGDPHGIGPELLVQTFSDPRWTDLLLPVVYGSGRVLQHYKQQLKAEKFGFANLTDASQPHGKRLNLVEVADYTDRIEPGTASPAAGKLGFQALERACADLSAGHLDALVTLPIDKQTIQSEEFRFPGHTEYLGAQFGRPNPLMLMVWEELRVAVATGHIPLGQVPSALKADNLGSQLQLLHNTLRIDFGLTKPRLAVLGLNPHAGDGGLLGSEDRELILPVVESLREKGLLVYGPYAADGFFASDQRHRFDGVLAMYHDQGLIPFKALSNGWGVNYTAGLPIIRTSPDHGTAYDIAGKGRADATSFRNALYYALDIYRMRQQNEDLLRTALRKPSVIDQLAAEEGLLEE